MIQSVTRRSCLHHFALLLLGMLLVSHLKAQVTKDTTRDIRLYRPPAENLKDTLPEPESTDIQQQFIRDSIKAREQYLRDSIQARQQFVRDSIEARLKFIQDSIIAREIFVRDSILRRKRILDSLNFLKTKLPVLLDASLRTLTEDVIIRRGKIDIVGDSILSDYSYRILPMDLSKPFKPWQGVINLSDNPIEINVDTIRNRINSLKTPFFTCSFSYGRASDIFMINEPGVVQVGRNERFYKVPFDSVFLDRQGRIIKIKRYIHFHRVVNNYQKGAPLFIHLSQVKQYVYNASNQMTSYQVVNFCDRWSQHAEKKVCYIKTYNIKVIGKTYVLTRQNDPSNDFSDGTFTCEFDNGDNLKSLAFKNNSGSENWKTFVELNEAGHVSRYLYQINGIVRQSMDIIYHLDDPGARHKIELISNTFEDDGICYHQKNLTTGKSRSRDKLTGEWGPWR